jgi:hypothetical protein
MINYNNLLRKENKNIILNITNNCLYHNLFVLIKFIFKKMNINKVIKIIFQIK